MDSISYVHELKELGIEVRFEKEELSSFDSSSDMIFNLLAAMAQEESRSLSENMKWGLRKRAEMGIRRIGNRHMLGYDQEGDKLVPTEDAWIVKYIFEQYAAGALIKDIIAGLKERGAVTMKGKDTFDYTTITGMLKNENYVGDRLIQKQPPQNYLTKKPDYTVDYESYFIENDHEPIVDREIWNAVQERLQKVERHPTWNKTTLDHFLYGKVYCAECGRKCKRLAKHKGKHSWVCTGAKSKACRIVNQIPEQHI